MSDEGALLAAITTQSDEDTPRLAYADRWPADGPLKWLRLEGTRIGTEGAAVLRARFGEKVELDRNLP